MEDVLVDNKIGFDSNSKTLTAKSGIDGHLAGQLGKIRVS